MDLGLKGKVALVTGASRGIGAAIAATLAAEGCDVALAARDKEGLARTAARVEQAGRRALIHASDLRDVAAPASLVDAALNALGRLDLVVCNAGATKRGDFLLLTEEDWADGFALKFHAHRRLLSAAWPHLARSQGAAVLIGGVGGRTPGAEFAIGGSVNAAILSLSKALAERGIADGVRVNVVNPGGVATERLGVRVKALAEKQGLDEAEARRRMASELGTARFGEPEEIAALVAFVGSPRAAYLQGALIDIDGGQTRTL